MDNSNAKEVAAVKCTITSCPGEYEECKIIHPVRHRNQVIIIDHVPADICSVCGDTLLRPETVRQIENVLQTATHPTRTVPVYEYA